MKRKKKEHEIFNEIPALGAKESVFSFFTLVSFYQFPCIPVEILNDALAMYWPLVFDVLVVVGQMKNRCQIVDTMLSLKYSVFHSMIVASVANDFHRSRVGAGAVVNRHDQLMVDVVAGAEEFPKYFECPF